MFTYKKCSPLVCVGGTARAVLRIAKKLYDLPPECHTVSRKQLDQLCSQLYQADRRAIDLILKLEPNRIHTIIPGIMILQHIFRLFAADEIVVAIYGVKRRIFMQEDHCTTKEKIKEKNRRKSDEEECKSTICK